MTSATDKNTVKFLNYELLSRLNAKAVKDQRNRTLDMENLPIDPKQVYPVVQTLLHNDIEIRTGILINCNDDIVWLDLTFKEFAGLPSVPRTELEDSGLPADWDDNDDNNS